MEWMYGHQGARNGVKTFVTTFFNDTGKLKSHRTIMKNALTYARVELLNNNNIMKSTSFHYTVY